jgi:hypothetical protein
MLLMYMVADCLINIGVALHTDKVHFRIRVHPVCMGVSVDVCAA